MITFETMRYNQVTRTDNGPGLTQCAPKFDPLPEGVELSNNGFSVMPYVNGVSAIIEVEPLEKEKSIKDFEPPPRAFPDRGTTPEAPAPIGGGFAGPKIISYQRVRITLKPETIRTNNPCDSNAKDWQLDADKNIISAEWLRDNAAFIEYADGHKDVIIRNENGIFRNRQEANRWESVKKIL